MGFLAGIRRTGPGRMVDRLPDFYVIGESGRRCPAFLQGEYRDREGRVWLVGFTQGRDSLPFLVAPEARRLVTWSGTITDIEIIPAEPVTGPWEVLVGDDNDRPAPAAGQDR